MTHYAKVKNGIVTQVIVAEPEFFDTFVDSSPGEWIQTSDTGSIRENFAGIGFAYSKKLDAFITPKPYASWTLNEATFDWEPPAPKPADNNNYIWDEESQSWLEENL